MWCIFQQFLNKQSKKEPEIVKMRNQYGTQL